LADSVKDTRQLFLFDDSESFSRLDSRLWRGSFQSRESTFQQLSPYVGKMKSGMAKALIKLYSKRKNVVLDPFSGSGVVPFEAVLSGRIAWANDLSPYAYTVTRGKLDASGSEKEAVNRAEILAKSIKKEASSVDISTIPEWITDFFHTDTLKEVVSAF